MYLCFRAKKRKLKMGVLPVPYLCFDEFRYLCSSKVSL